MRTTLIAVLGLLAVACGEGAGAGGGGGAGGAGGSGGGEVVDPCAPPSSIACADEATFEPCGGDPTGTWTWESGCAVVPAEGPTFDGGIAACSAPVTTWVELDISGTTTLEGGIRDDELAAGSVRRWRIDPACRAAAFEDMSPVDACRSMSGGYADMITGELIGEQECTTCPDTGCGCVTRIDVPRPAGTPGPSPYTVEGTEIVAGGWRQQFCVEGDRMRLFDASPGFTVVGTLRRVANR